MKSRYRIKEFTGEPWLIDKKINVTTDGDRILQKPEADTTTGSVASRTDTYTVPSKKRWTILSAFAVRQVAQKMTFKVTLGGTTIVIDQSGAADTNKKMDMAQPILLNSGDDIIVEFTAAAAGTLTSYIGYLEEDAY